LANDPKELGQMSLNYVLVHWEQIRSQLVVTIDKFSDADLSFQPFAASWSVKQIMLHIGHEEQIEIHYGLVQETAVFPPEPDPNEYPTIAAIKSFLARIHKATEQYLKNLVEDDLTREVETPWGTSASLEAMIGHVMEHEIHHRAELSLILGLLGRQGLDA
jgi:uncharacterized damage-inducible protein DinB